MAKIIDYGVLKENNMIGIVVISFNHKLFTSMCINSILSHTDRKLYRLCLVDNGSIDGTKEWATNLYNKRIIDHFISNHSNFGACRASNQGIQWCLDNKYDILIMANDHIVTDNWLRYIKESGSAVVNPFVFYSMPLMRRLGGVGSLIDKYKALRIKYLQQDDEELMKKVLNDTYGNINEFAIQFSERFEESPYISVDVYPWPGCVFYSNHVISEIGLRDEEFLKYTLAGGADLDYRYRVWLKGFKSSVSMRSFVHHWGSITTRKGGLIKDGYREGYKSKWAEALNYLKRKWNIPMNNPLPKEFGL